MSQDEVVVDQNMGGDPFVGPAGESTWLWARELLMTQADWAMADWRYLAGLTAAPSSGRT